MHVEFHLSQPQNAVHFVPHGEYLLKGSNMVQISATTMSMHLEDDLDQAEEKPVKVPH
jgi:hypothetical protein